MTDRYQRSRELLERALEVIPLGAQTFSKSITQYPRGVSPHFAGRAKGARLWDADGNEYLDLVGALAAVLLGYGDEETDAAVRAQLESGVSFTLSHELEIEVAERLVRLVPCAEQVRFGKNGTDATSAAVRLARARTGRDHVALCGYHGWQDWSIGTTTRDKGVPAAVRALSHAFPYGDLGALERVLAAHPSGFAAVVMEPAGASLPPAGYLAGVRDLAHRHGALLVFDETITGMRFHSGGAQALYGVTPDLATFGKGIANGFPLSAVLGPRELMREMEEVFFSGTFGGEALSLAAARSVLDRVVRDRVPERLAERGTELQERLHALLESTGSAGVFSLAGHPSWTFLRIAATERCSDFEIKTLLLQRLFERGVLFLGTFNLSLAHGPAELDEVVRVLREVLPELAERARAGRVREALRTEPLRPLFKVR